MAGDAIIGRIVAFLEVNDTKFTAGMTKARTQFSGLHSDMQSKGKAITGIISSIGTAMIAVGAVKFLEGAVQKAIADQLELVKLKTAVEATGQAWSSYSGFMDEATTAGIKLGFEDAKTTAALAKLTLMTGSASVALKDLGLAQDVARGTGMDLLSASSLVAKVEEGRIGIASRMLPFLKATMTQEEAMAALREHFAGQAAAYEETAAGKAEKLSASYDHLQETIGYKLLPAFEKVVDELSDAIDWFDSLDEDTKSNYITFGLWAGGLAIAVPTIINVAKAITMVRDAMIASKAAAAGGIGVNAVAGAGAGAGAGVATGLAEGAAVAAVPAGYAALKSGLLVPSGAVPAAVPSAAAGAAGGGIMGAAGRTLGSANPAAAMVAFAASPQNQASFDKNAPEGKRLLDSVSQIGAVKAAAVSLKPSLLDMWKGFTDSASGAGTLNGGLLDLTDTTKGYTTALEYELNDLSLTQTADRTALQDKIAVKAAHEALTAAIKKYGKGSDEARVARLNLTAAENKAKDSAEVAADAARSAAAAAARAAAKWDLLADAIGRANHQYATSPMQGSAIRVPGTQLTLASGGVFSRATSAIIGEAGTEVIVPTKGDANSRALLATAASLNGVSGGGSVSSVTNYFTITANVSNDYDVDRLAERLQRIQSTRARAIGATA
jgi:hypothetical protein